MYISQKQMLAYMEDLKKSADIKITLPEMMKKEEGKMEEAHEHADGEKHEAH